MPTVEDGSTGLASLYLFYFCFVKKWKKKKKKKQFQFQLYVRWNSFQKTTDQLNIVTYHNISGVGVPSAWQLSIIDSTVNENKTIENWKFENKKWVNFFCDVKNFC